MKLYAKNILITGSQGFIGTNLQNYLQNLGARVTGFDKELGDDILDITKVETQIKKGFDVIFQLAGYSGSTYSNSDIKSCFDLNSIATAHIIKSILTHSPNTKLILSGSRLEYGKPQHLPVDENHPTNPNSAYGISKLIATELALVFAKSDGLKTTIFRTSNVYGSHKNSNFKGYNVINYFIDLAKKGGTIKIFGDGSQIRDYIYIDDLVDAFCRGIDSKADGQIYNLGYGKPIKFADMARTIVKTVSRGKIKFVKWPHDYKSVETGDYISDITKIKDQLEFSPHVNFAEGILKTVQNEK